MFAEIPASVPMFATCPATVFKFAEDNAATWVTCVLTELRLVIEVDIGASTAMLAVAPASAVNCAEFSEATVVTLPDMLATVVMFVLIAANVLICAD